MIAAENVTVIFRHGLRRRKTYALDDFSLTISEGDFFALIGRNGAGKSTAMYCFLGLIRPEQGSIRVLGQPPTPGHVLFGSIGYVPEEPHYHLYLTVREALHYYACLYRKQIPPARLTDALDRLGLADSADLPLAKCSKGMKQKLGLAQCLIAEPRLLFLDEPTRGLDPIIVRDVREILRELHRQGVTVVLNSHVLTEIEMLATRAAIIERGRVLAHDDISRLTAPTGEDYDVEFETTGEIPDYVLIIHRAGDTCRGIIPAAALYPFIEHVRVTGARIRACALRRRSLEEAFATILKGGHADA